MNFPKFDCFSSPGCTDAACRLWTLLALLLVTFSLQAQEFSLRTQAAGLGLITATNGVAVADYNRDGNLDIYFVANASYDPLDATTWNRLYAGRDDGTFYPVNASPLLSGRDSSTVVSSMGYKMGASWGDYDNDGWPDLFLTHVGPNQLFHNNGDGSFSEVTAMAGVGGGKTQLSSSALWFDYDRDGDLDLYVGNWQDYAATNRDRSNWLYENNGDGTFSDVSQFSGLDDDGATWTSVAIDANSDQLLDIYLANDFGENKFYVNNGDKTFSEKTAEYGLEDPYHGMGIAITDCDGNGFFDIYLTNITESGFAAETNPLFLNSGQNYFVNDAAAAGVSLAGWGWGTEFFDLENDGDEDLFVVTGLVQPDYPNVLFRSNMQDSLFGFEEVADIMGLADSASARGLVVFDYDNDGDQDFLVSNYTGDVALYQNRLPQHNWLKIELEGTASNRSGFGSIVEATAAGKTFRRYFHGAQFLGQNILPVHIGLGEAPLVESLVITWPGGIVDQIDSIAVNQTIKVRENQGLVTGIGGQSANRPPLPTSIYLAGNYPNPFNGTTNIRFQIEQPGVVEVEIFNIRGQQVARLKAAGPESGEYEIAWNGTDHQGLTVSSGLYFYRVRQPEQQVISTTGKMLYVR